MSLNRRQQIGSWVGVFAIVGVVAAPAVASAVSSTANTTINATIGSTISVSTSTTVAISLTPTSGGVVSSNSDTVSVSTNNAAGYTLSLKDSDTNTSLVSGGNNITAWTGTAASPTALGNNTWGWAVAGLGTFDASYSAETNNGSSATKWAGIVASSGSADTLKTTATTASGDTTTVWYAAKATTAMPNGTYSDTVTYTATTN
jgi:hypothetical protein